MVNQSVIISVNNVTWVDVSNMKMHSDLGVGLATGYNKLVGFRLTSKQLKYEKCDCFFKNIYFKLITI